MNTKKIIWTIVNCICSTITFLAFVVSIPLMIAQFEDYAERVAQGPYYHTVGDTRIIMQDFHSLAFCSGLILAVNRDESTVNATLYNLSEFPVLDGMNELNHTLSINGKDDYDYYYLHPGSNVTISTCTHSTQFSFDIIKGRQNFELWLDGKRGRVFASFEVGSNAWCRGPSTLFVVYNMTIPEEDDWYFAADALGATANLSLQRYEYTVMNTSVLSSCSAGGNNPDSCIISKSDFAYVPTFLLVIGEGPSRSNVEANVNCAVGGDLLAGVILTVILTLIIIFCTCMCCIFSCIKMYYKNC